MDICLLSVNELFAFDRISPMSACEPYRLQQSEVWYHSISYDSKSAPS